MVKISKKQTALLLMLMLAIFCLAGQRQDELNKPKNIIIMIADGCGYSHIDAASLYEYGETGVQVYENFPVKLSMSTYAFGGSYEPQKARKDFDYVKGGATDSAAAATAMACGVKTNKGVIGMDSDGNEVRNLVERCEQMGKATGVVTSVQWSHATPAGFVAHNPSRYNYEQIAREMVYESGCEVIMGCGHPDYDDNGNDTWLKNYKYVGGSQTWKELKAGMAGGDRDGDGGADAWKLVESKGDFLKLMAGDAPSRVLGVARVAKTLQCDRGGERDIPYVAPRVINVPTLAEMTRGALNVLDEDEDGFFLMVEGGAVDWAGHTNAGGRVIEEQTDFNRSVIAVVNWVKENSSWDETLVIVTSDHETGYMTGPGCKNGSEGAELKGLENNGAMQSPGFEWHSGGHTNQLIPFFAKGCGAEHFKSNVKKDLVRGDYIDNVDLARVCFFLLK